MHGLNRPISRPLPPKAQRRPKFSVHHGVELVDEYAWLRADNWQEVMRDPSVLDPQIRAYLEAENAYTEARAGRHVRRCRQTLYAEMKARIKEDDSSVPAPDGPYEYFVSYVTGGQYPRLCRRPRGGGARGDPARRQRGGRGQDLLAARRHRAQPRSPLSGLRRRRQGLGALHHPHPRPRHRQGPARRHPGHAQRHRLGAPTARRLFYVRLDANQRPLFVYRHRVGTAGSRGRADLRGEGHRLLRRRRPDPVAPVHHHRGARPPDHRGLPDRRRSRPRASRAWWRRASTATSTPSSTTATA